MSALNTQVAGKHYKNLKIQPVEYIHANGIPFIEGCIIKYATRWREKGGAADLKKIIHFTELLLELEEKAVQKPVAAPKAPIEVPKPRDLQTLLGYPVPLGTDLTLLRLVVDFSGCGYRKMSNENALLAHEFIQEQGKLIHEMKTGESVVHIVAPTYARAQDLAIRQGWPKWTYHSVESPRTLAGLRDSIVVILPGLTTPYGVCRPDNIILRWF